MQNGTDGAAALDAALALVNSGNEQEAYKGKLALRRAVAAAGAPGREAERAEAAQKLAAALADAKTYSSRARCTIAELLADVGGDAEVAALEGALADLEVRGAARWALDRIPAAAATAALVKSANESIGARYRVGLMNSLGQRSGEGVVEALKRCATEDPLTEVRLAAAEALANHPDPASFAVVMKVMESPLTAQQKGRLWKASVRLASAVAASGNKLAAERMFRAIADGGPAPQKKAAQAAVDALS
jgi:hypothetical protein